MLHSSSMPALVAALLIAATFGCSQKDPGGDQGAAGTGANLDTDASAAAAADFFPLADGATFTVRKFYKQDGTTRDDTTTYEAVDYKGQAAILATGGVDAKGEIDSSVLLELGTKVHRVHKETKQGTAVIGSVSYEPGFLRFDRAWVDKAPGFSVTETYRRIEYDAAGAVKKDEMRSHAFTVDGVDESLTLSVGTFDGCVSVRRQSVLAAGQAASEDDDKRFWFCPAVGKAKELTLSNGDTEEFVGCSIPGQDCP